MIDKFDVLKILDMDIIQLELSQAICDILLNNKIKIVGDIVSCTEEEIRYILKKREYLDEVKEKLDLLGLSFKYSKGHNGIAKTLEDLDLSLRTYNVLKRAGINTVSDLMYTDISEIRRRIGLGLNRKCFDEILLKLKELGVRADIKDDDLEELGFSKKLIGVLRRGGIYTVEDLVSTDILKIRKLMHMGAIMFEDVLVKLIELGYNPIEIETKKLEEIKNSFDFEQNKILTDNIEIKKIEIDNYRNLKITLSESPTEEWVGNFNEIRANYLEDENKVSGVTRNIVKKLIYEIKVSAKAEIYYCSATEIINHERYKEILTCFVTSLNDILNLTHEKYSESIIVESSIRTKNEIDETVANIEWMKSRLSERDKIISLNNELCDILIKENSKHTAKCNLKMTDLDIVLKHINDCCFKDDYRLTDNEVKEFHNLILPFYNAKKMYELALNEKIMDFYFLHCANDFYYHKSYLINECLHKKDYETADKLVERMIKTLTYKDSKETMLYTGNWQLDIIWNFADLSRHYSTESSEEDILFLSRMVDRALMYLDPHNQRKMNDNLHHIWPFVAERNQYAIDLLVDTTDYCATPRPRGFSRRVKDVACNISNSFVRLENMGCYDTIIRILELLKYANENIKPYNFKHYFEVFIYKCKPHTIKMIKKKKRSLFNYWLSLNPDKECLLKLEDKLN